MTVTTPEGPANPGETVTAPPAPDSYYPVHVEGDLDPSLSRGLWIVKWILLIPHYIVLGLLWVAFWVTTVLAFFAILITGRFPRSLFDFNVGVLRWSWRVAFYGYHALGTDRYPPFTLAERPDYPARFWVDYPERLSRGLVLVKWWLLAIPHFVVVAFLMGSYDGNTIGDDQVPFVGLGLIGFLVLVAAVVLLFQGHYPRRLFDLVAGLDRWTFRVAGYVSLMTDRYPPFALDQGGRDPAPTPAGGAVAAHARARWSVGRTIPLVVGSVLVMTSLVIALAGLALAVFDVSEEDDDGFLMTKHEPLRSNSFAIASESLRLHLDGEAARLPEAITGDVRLNADSVTGRPIFIGIGPTADVDRYLSGVGHDTLVGLDDEDDEAKYRVTTGGPPPTAPTGERFWDVQDAGVEDVQITWTPKDGDWTVVVMNADGTPVVDTRIAAGAEFPIVAASVVALLVTAGVAFLLGIVLIAVSIWMVSRELSRHHEERSAS
ncbi:DUF4389 domain-containing protein [Aeromicrobium duanguangcaii]|uniref:DUF4389 domain-containing protein n=1 Tax=Aeromicrobium duanguangcaii TaxID=2968086 RepID=A0ABY5KM15_9ACTN|nr:DUF4389 domain-containing protein [Aeromicrobium duanguangcaii]MCD9153529.1 DUF4389 domain-containing protein [Aeromicrobium duanguangcaii]UUI69383.1 DUF4389 domain-containing protein [Aeromicrobium duanguangcaii]